MTDTQFVFPPWNDEQVNALNRWQSAGTIHPFTCGNDSKHRPLVAMEDGWHCRDCAYTQNWAHAIMLQPPPKPLPI